MPAYALAETLGFEQDASALQRIVVIRLGEQLVGLLVESVGEGDAMRDATVRPLPQRLQRRVVRGAIVRPEDGQIALLIDPQEALAQRLAGAALALRPVGPPAAPRAAPYALIVDDSVTIRRTLEQALTQAGFKTGQARDGREALEMMERALPRVLILDVEMPRLSGFQLLKIMRRSSVYQQVRVVMLTSRAADEHREYALAIGADAYLVKPFDACSLNRSLCEFRESPTTAIHGRNGAHGAASGRAAAHGPGDCAGARLRWAGASPGHQRRHEPAWPGRTIRRPATHPSAGGAGAARLRRRHGYKWQDDHQWPGRLYAARRWVAYLAQS
jgi:CheY-like chemotaxis protein